MSGNLIQNVSAVQSALRDFSIKRALNTDNSYQTTICLHGFCMHIWLSFFFTRATGSLRKGGATDTGSKTWFEESGLKCGNYLENVS